MASRELTDLSIANAPTKTRNFAYDDGSIHTQTGVGNGTKINTSMRTLGDSGAGAGNIDGTTPSGGVGFNDTLSRNLADAAKGLDGGTGNEEKTIMERFASRAGLTKQSGIDERKLTDSDYGEKIAGQLDTNASNYIDANEGRAGFGTQTAAVTYLEKSGAKRVMDLEKARDSLLLQSKIGEASRLDGLIADEQSAITTARKTWLDNLLSLGNENRANNQDTRAQAQEGRDALGFETPDESRLGDYTYAQKTAIADSVRKLSATAPDAGITTDDTYDSAITKYKNSQTYKNDQKKGDLEIQQAEANIRSTNSLANSRTLGTNPNGGGATYGSDLDALVDAAAGTISSKFGQQQFYSRISKARNDGDKINAIASTVLANAPAAEKLDFANQASAVGSIDQAINLLDNGVQTGLLQNAQQYTYNLAGQDFDPKLAQIKQLLISAIQPYRNSVTGAAWGSQEEAEYQSLFGSTKYTPAALKQRLQGIKQIMLRKTSTGLNQAVNPLGSYGDVFSAPLGADTNPQAPASSGNMFDNSGL